MKIIIDSREKPQAIKKILEIFQLKGIEFKYPQKLDVGDYFNPDSPKVIIDRKQSLNEVCQNLYVDRPRFFRELQRALKQHIKLIVLVESGGGIKRLQDVSNWINPNHNGSKLFMSGRELMDRMYAAQISFGIEWRFCDKKDTGLKIIEILGGNNEKQ